MRVYFISCLTAISALPLWANPVQFTGAIGPYEIEAELTRTQERVEGRYRYAGKDTWIRLTGETFAQDALHLTESVNGDETGQMFLELTETGLNGFWAQGDAHHPAILNASVGATNDLFTPDETPEVSASITGRYHVGAYWVNDLFAPNYEIGFNGGNVDVAQVDPETLLIHFDFVVGPTYHIASFRGVAKRIGPNTFEHNQIIDGDDKPCLLRFEFDETSLSVTDDNNGWACQFGARAHANFDLQKISNTAEFQDQW